MVYSGIVVKWYSHVTYMITMKTKWHQNASILVVVYRIPYCSSFFLSLYNGLEEKKENTD